MADRLANAIDLKHALNDPAARVPQPGSDTIYLAVVDKDRMAVSFINSIYHAFGSGIITANTGIALQNRGTGFATDPRHPNCIGPGKRPFHTIIPAMARRDGRVILAFGVMGGAYQPMGHVTVALNRFVYGLDLQESLEFPRLFANQGVVSVEAGIDDAVRAGLAARGHTLVESGEPFGGGQAIAIEASGLLQGGSDHRKDGLALGF
jgi:gamma-glutamyltranspeptidase/glutathione hydrolase